jgi:hypothetical protein
MTFVAPTSSAASTGPAIRLSIPARGRLPLSRIRAADEDSARRALGSDFDIPASLASGSVLEGLARIALG